LTILTKLGIGVSHLIANIRNQGAMFRNYILGLLWDSKIDLVCDNVDIGVLYSFYSNSLISLVNPL
jgi:hypothetical protein